MKKQFLLMMCCLFFLAVLSSCFHRHHHTSISISDSRNIYQLYASYDKNKTHKLQRLLDEDLRDDNDWSFKNERVDETITLDDRTTFYMRLYPGELKIKLDKSENSEESCQKMKDVFEDIKYLLGENNTR